MALRSLIRGIVFLGLVSASVQFTHYEEDSCQLIGDPDVYGIGVRIGYYFAFFSGIIALLFNNARAASENAKAILVFTFALFIILVVNTKNGSLASFEWYLVSTMVFMLLGGVLNQVFSHPSLPTVGCLLIAFGLYSAVQPWPHFTLVDQGRKAECDLKAFIYVPFDFYNSRFVTFTKVMSVISAVVGVILIPSGIWLLLTGFGDGLSEDDISVRRPFTLTIGLFGLSVGAFGIAFTEKMIQVNNIDLSDASFSSAGQLIPFLVGLFTLLSTIGSIFRDIVKR